MHNWYNKCLSLIYKVSKYVLNTSWIHINVTVDKIKFGRSNIGSIEVCDIYGLKHMPTSAKNPQANAVPERIHVVIANMLHTSEFDMAELVNASDIDVFLSDATWVICSIYHTVL